jgi:hypothetical protein
VQTVRPVPNPVAVDAEQTGGLWVRALRSVPWFTFRIESTKVEHVAAANKLGNVRIA